MTVAVAIECEYPQKMFYRINEVSRITGIKPYVLRYWETEFPQLAPAKDGGDQRRYKAVDIEMISEIKRLLYEEKFTIAGARRRLEQNGKAHPRVVELAPEAATAVARASTGVERTLRRARRMIADLRRDVTNLHNFI